MNTAKQVVCVNKCVYVLLCVCQSLYNYSVHKFMCFQFHHFLLFQSPSVSDTIQCVGAHCTSHMYNVIHAGLILSVQRLSDSEL